jgi:tetratricopeptide (TPR) repeat protein
MAIRVKTKRRLIILVLLVVVVGLLLGSFVGVRRWQINRQVAEWRRQGMIAFDAGDYPSALNNLGMCLMRQQANCTDVDLIYRYAESRRRVEEPDGSHNRQAILWFRRLLVLQPDDLEAESTLLELYSKEGYASETNALADEILKRDPVNIPALRAKAIACSQLHTIPRRKEALAIAEKVVALKPLDLEMHLMINSLLLGLNTPGANVVERARQLQEKSPDETRFILLRAVACRTTGDVNEAQKWALAAAEKHAPDAFYTVTLVRLLDSLDQFDRSMTVLEQAASVTSSDEIERALVRRLWETNRFQEVVNRVLAEKPPGAAPATMASTKPGKTTPSENLALAAHSLARLNRPAEAETLIKTLAQRTNDPMAKAWLPVLRQAVGRDTTDQATLIDVYRQGIAKDQRNAQLRYFLGETYTSVGERELAVGLWEEASLLEPAWPAPQLALSRLLASLGRVDQALQLARYTLKRFPHNAVAAITLATIWSAQLERDNVPDNADLQLLVSEIQKAIPGEPETQVLQILLLARSGKPSEAATALKSAIHAAKPPSQDTLLRLAAISRQYNLQLEEECLNANEKAHGLTPDLALLRAGALAAAGKTVEGLALIDKARPADGSDGRSWDLARVRYLEVNQDPHSKDSWISLADKWPADTQIQRMALDASSVQEDAALVQRLADRLHGLTGDQGVSWRLAKARLLLRPGAPSTEISDATKILQETLGTTPESQEARRLLAIALERAGNSQGAIEQLQQAAQADPISVRLNLELARIHQGLGRFDKAQEFIDKAIANPAATFYEQRVAAQLLARQGQPDWAIRVLENAGAKDPGNLSADMLLARLHFQRGHTDKATEACQRLLASPDQASAVPFVASLYAAMGKNDLAKEALDRLDKLELKPGMRELLLAIHYAGRGDFDAATGFCRKGLLQTSTLPALWRVLIFSSVRQGKLKDALDAASQAATANPTDPAFAAFVGAGPNMLTLGDAPMFRPVESAILEDPAQVKAALECLRVLVELTVQEHPSPAVLSKLKSLAESNPRFLSLQLLVYNIYASSNRTDDAIAIATRTSETFPADEQAARFAAEALAAAGHWVEVAPAAAEWHRRAGQETVPPDLLAAQAYLHLRDGKSARAALEPHLASARKDPAKYADVLSLYAGALVLTNSSAQAADLLAPHLPSVAAIRANWVALAASSLPQADAEAWLNRVAPLMVADSWPDQLALADAWFRLSRRLNIDTYQSNGAQVLAAAGAHCKPEPRSLLFAASLLDGANNYSAAVAAYDRVLQLEPDNNIARNNLAMVFVRSKTSLDRALKLAREIVATSPKDPNFLDSLASVYVARGDYTNALSTIRKAIQMAPLQVEWRLRETEILTDAAQFPEARASFNALSASIPNPQQLPPDLRDRLEALRKKLG